MLYDVRLYVYVKKLSTFIWPHPLLDVLFSLLFSAIRCSESTRTRSLTHSLCYKRESVNTTADAICVCVRPFGVDL